MNLDISGFINNSNLNENIKTLATKSKLKAEQDKIVKLQEFDSSYFIGNFLFGNDGFQNMFVYQPALSMLELKTRATTMLLVGNQKGYILLNLHHYILLSCVK